MNASHGQGKAAFKGAEQASSGGGSSRGPETGERLRKRLQNETISKSF